MSVFFVKITPHYYSGHLPPMQVSLAVDADSRVLFFDIEQEAQDWIDKKEAELGAHYDGCVVLSHGQYAPDSYEIVDGVGGCLANTIDADYWSADDFIEVARADIPPEVLSRLDALNVVAADFENEDYLIFRGDLKINGTTWRLAYAVDPCAAQLYSDDLGMIDWTDPSYYERV